MFRKIILFSVAILLSLFLSITAHAAPKKEYWDHWAAFSPVSMKEIHYPVWKEFLKKYLVIYNNQIYVQYGKVNKADKTKLGKSITQLSTINIAEYTRGQQLAYWINLYNMETVYLVLQHPNLKSITEIDSGVFSHGPWDKKLLTVDGIKLSLNDVEHRILRPIWGDPRIHAAVNCASISCPNLQETPFKASDISVQLNQAFRQFVNSPKGLLIKNNKIYLSEIFSWYGDDFGSKNQMKAFIAAYLSSQDKRELLLQPSSALRFQKYNWKLNISSPANNK